MPVRTPLTYRDAGVDIDAGDALVERIKDAAARTRRPGVLAGLGGFGALFELPSGYDKPVLVSGTDGVGTKLKLAIQYGKHDTIGQDLVAMCANDIAVVGAEPLFFLDYYASGKLDVDTAAEIVGGIATGCELAGCALVGGETAELPGMYHDGDYDLAGFCVGIVEKARIIDGAKVADGDVVLGIASSGLHSNGYSLARKVVEVSGAKLADDFDGRPLGEVLLEPTRIYVKALLALAASVDVHALAHITGGGLPGNLPRVLPDGVGAQLDASAWQRPRIFDWLQAEGAVADDEMYRTFNCGIGMCVVVASADATRATEILAQHGERTAVIGRIANGVDGVVIA